MLSQLVISEPLLESTNIKVAVESVQYLGDEVAQVANNLFQQWAMMQLQRIRSRLDEDVDEGCTSDINTDLEEEENEGGDEEDDDHEIDVAGNRADEESEASSYGESEAYWTDDENNLWSSADESNWSDWSDNENDP